jgi:hypothetical protein
MSEQYQILPVNVPLTIYQGVTFYKLWNFYLPTGEAFPFFGEDGYAEWTGRSMIKSNYDDQSPLVSLTSANGGVFFQEANGVASYGMIISAAQASALPYGNAYYDIEFERLADGWVIRPQHGKVTIMAEVTK